VEIETDYVRSWVESNTDRKLTDFQALCCNILTRSFNTGVYNLKINWKKVNWNYVRGGVRFTIECYDLATFDFDHLTYLVIAAHEHCVRISIMPATFRHLRITMSLREREGGMSARHPTIDQAIEDFRK
jgi:hypothetical protein